MIRPLNHEFMVSHTGGAAMLKFIVVGCRRSELTRDQFRRYFRETHGPLATAIPGVRRYIQNFVEPDERRNPPWDVVVEFWFDDREAMEMAWQSQEGRQATDDNSNCLDLERSGWSVVDEVVVLGGTAQACAKTAGTYELSK